MSRTRVYLPRETAAVSVGADDVAIAIARQAKDAGHSIELIRNGSWGASWLEPMVEVVVGDERIAYGNVDAADVPELFAANFLIGGEHPKRLGPTIEIPYLINQDRWTFWRCGLTDPLSIDDFLAHHGFKALQKAFDIGAQTVIDTVRDSGLRGRGGAGFPTGIKWQTVADVESDQKYIACNADEGDSGTFSDRLLMEGDPLGLIESMAIAGYAVGASRGYIYLRSEYPLTHLILSRAIEIARDKGWLGNDIQGSGFSFDIELHLGAGSYVCGEETAMLESLEGKPGIVRYKPPLPAIAGLFGKPTVVNNVVTLGSVANIVNMGSEKYAAFGIDRSKGTLAFQLGGQHQTRRSRRESFRHNSARNHRRLGRWHRQRTPCQSRPGWRSIGCVPAGGSTRHAAGLRVIHRNRRDDRSWRHRRIRRYSEHGATSALCPGVLRDRILRQVHAVPHRRDARYRGRRQNGSGRRQR